jgi:hypothetical protein
MMGHFFDEYLFSGSGGVVFVDQVTESSESRGVRAFGRLRRWAIRVTGPQRR